MIPLIQACLLATCTFHKNSIVVNLVSLLLPSQHLYQIRHKLYGWHHRSPPSFTNQPGLMNNTIISSAKSTRGIKNVEDLVHKKAVRGRSNYARTQRFKPLDDRLKSQRFDEASKRNASLWHNKRTTITACRLRIGNNLRRDKSVCHLFAHAMLVLITCQVLIF